MQKYICILYLEFSFKHTYTYTKFFHNSPTLCSSVVVLRNAWEEHVTNSPSSEDAVFGHKWLITRPEHWRKGRWPVPAQNNMELTQGIDSKLPQCCKGISRWGGVLPREPTVWHNGNENMTICLYR